MGTDSYLIIEGLTDSVLMVEGLTDSAVIIEVSTMQCSGFQLIFLDARVAYNEHNFINNNNNLK